MVYTIWFRFDLKIFLCVQVDNSRETHANYARMKCFILWMICVFITILWFEYVVLRNWYSSLIIPSKWNQCRFYICWIFIPTSNEWCWKILIYVPRILGNLFKCQELVILMSFLGHSSLIISFKKKSKVIFCDCKITDCTLITIN